ncbi:MAG: hypothetical protein HDT30_05755 [Clostridiales bacterium]|nr:hypothetical protein [Clostridiales bacterium]
MKKLSNICLVLVLCITCVLTGCNKKNNSESYSAGGKTIKVTVTGQGEFFDLKNVRFYDYVSDKQVTLNEQVQCVSGFYEGSKELVFACKKGKKDVVTYAVTADVSSDKKTIVIYYNEKKTKKDTYKKK